MPLSARLLLAPTLLALAFPLAGQEEAAGDTAGEEAAAEKGPWSHSLKLGAFLNQTASRNADASRDSVIGATNDSVSYRLSLDGNLTWAAGNNELKQELRLRYGRIKEDNDAWETNSDEIRYDITGYHFLGWLTEKDFLYLAGRAETVFEGPTRTQVLVDPALRGTLRNQLGLQLYDLVPLEIERSPRALTPGRTFLASGYGQRFKNALLPESDQLEWRLGVRAQRRWGDDLSADEKEVKVGAEFVIDYKNQIREDIDWFFYAEAFAPFDDLGHITSWAETGINININKYIMASISARAYYETAPDSVTTTPGDGFDSLSLRQEALIGLTYTL